MMWNLILRQKIRIGLLLALIMCLIIVSGLISRHDMKTINKSFSSIYSDRLLPTTDLFYLSENMLSKRIYLEQYLYSGKPVSETELKAQLQKYNLAIDTLVYTIEQTYLVDLESQYLQKLKTDIARNRVLEDRIIELSAANNPAEAQKTFQVACSGNLYSTIGDLNKLVQIQTDIGKNLMKDSQSAASSIHFMHGIQIAITIVIGLIIQMILLGAKVVKVKPQPFYYN